MDIKEFVQEKRDLERRLHSAIQGEMSAFAAKTGLSVRGISFSVMQNRTLDGETSSFIGDVRVDVPL